MESNVIVTSCCTTSPLQATTRDEVPSVSGCNGSQQVKTDRELRMEKILGDLVNLRLYKLGRKSINMDGLFVYGWNEEFYKQNKIRLWAEAEAILGEK